MKLCSKYSGDKFWQSVLLDVATSCIRPTISFPLNETLINGDYTGCLAGSAAEANDGLILTPAASETYGAVLYQTSVFQTDLAIDFDFIFTSPSSDNGADGVYFYFNSSEDSLTEDANIQGYLVGFSEYHQWISIKYGPLYIGNDIMFPYFLTTLTPNTPYHASIIFNDGTFHISLNGDEVAVTTDPNYNTRVQVGHNLAGLGARCGTVNAQHKVSNLIIVQD